MKDHINLFELPSTLPDHELVHNMISGDGVRIERIISAGQISPDGFWYDQQEDEWVLVLQGCGEIEFESGERCRLCAGDSLLIRAHVKHRVSYTSQDPPCVWLCVFGHAFQSQ